MGRRGKAFQNMGRACVTVPGHKPAAGPRQSSPRSCFLPGRKWPSTGTWAWVGRVSRAGPNSTLALAWETRLTMRQNDQCGSLGGRAVMPSKIKEAPGRTQSHVRFPWARPTAGPLCLHTHPGPYKAAPGAELMCCCSQQPCGADRCRHGRRPRKPGHRGTSQALASQQLGAQGTFRPSSTRQKTGSQQLRLKLSF